MIKSLYMRVVLTFLAVVIVSLTFASIVSSRLYDSSFVTGTQSDITNTGEQMLQLYADMHPDDIEAFFTKWRTLNHYSFMLFDDRYEAKLFVEPSAVLPRPNRDDIEQVIQGRLYRNWEHRTIRDPANLMAGFPVDHEGKRYAFFVFPYFEQYRKFQEATNTVLLLVLAFGSVLVIIASRYVVEPLRKMTQATRRLAKGDFNVSLDMNRKDELGLLAESFDYMAGELKQLETMRRDFVSNVSHEIQTPLTSIRGFAKALHNDNLKAEDRRRYVQIITNESERLSRLSENLLKLASLESEHHPFHTKLIDLDEQLRQIVVASEPLWSAKRLDIRLNLPRTKLIADEDQLNQVWTNLLNNSIKFTPEGGTVDIAIEHGTEHVKVSFADTGIGISAADQERIFQRFFKADRSRKTTDAGGSGLGLAIAGKIVAIHGGTISVSSEPGSGATFVVKLPVIVG